MDDPPLSSMLSPNKRPGLPDLRWLVWYAARGFYELVKARMAFAGLEARHIPLRNDAARQHAMEGKVGDGTHIARISYVLPRLSARMPWRSDCLVQAIAGQNWLTASGLASEIRIGVRRHHVEEFGAHAWLVHGGCVVTGGDISSYEVLLGSKGGE